MGCPGGTRSVFTCPFQAKRELHCILLGKKAIIITSKHGTTIFIFLGKVKEKLARKARVNNERVYRIAAHAPWASHYTLYIELIQYGRRIGQNVYCLCWIIYFFVLQSQTMSVEPTLIQDLLGFWIPRHGIRVPGAGFSGTWIPGFFSSIPNSKVQDSLIPPDKIL